tara:strand:+ start:8697 stop:8798 length:102 start_codon:yes stop_codon:yes gene_type:complete
MDWAAKNKLISRSRLIRVANAIATGRDKEDPTS